MDPDFKGFSRPMYNYADMTPGRDAIRAFLQTHGLSGSGAARMAYLTGGNQIRKYTTGGNPSTMDAVRWFALHAHIILSADQIKEIEDSMIEDCCS